jgi:hypothetical protein
LFSNRDKIVPVSLRSKASGFITINVCSLIYIINSI